MVTRRGQAMVELAMGMFALALVVSALCGFALYIVKSLAMQNALRVKTHSAEDSVEVSSFAATYIFGTQKIEIKEKVELPDRTIIR